MGHAEGPRPASDVPRHDAVSSLSITDAESFWDRLGSLWTILARSFDQGSSDSSSTSLWASEDSRIALVLGLAKLERNMIAGLMSHQQASMYVSFSAINCRSFRQTSRAGSPTAHLRRHQLLPYRRRAMWVLSNDASDLFPSLNRTFNPYSIAVKHDFPYLRRAGRQPDSG